MTKSFRTFALSALVGPATLPGAIGATTTNADATSIYIGNKHNGVHIGIGYPGYKPHYKHGYHKPYYKPVNYGACSSWKAVSKARAAGMYGARVKFRNYKTVAVSGKVYGHWETFYYGNTNWCPRVG